MSGPKSSRYTLTAAQRRMLQEQLRIAREAMILEERKRNELEKISHIGRNIKSKISEINSVLEKSQRFSVEGEKARIDVGGIEKRCKQVLKIIDQAERTTTASTLEHIMEVKESVSKVLKDVNAVYREAEAGLKRQEDSFRDNVMGQIMLGADLSFSNISDRNAFSRSKFKKSIESELDKISGIEISTELENKYKILIEKAEQIKSVDFLENFHSLTVVPFVKECLEYEKIEKSIGEDYRALRLRYESLAKDMGEELQDIPMSEGAISALLDKISALEAIELQKNEESYICQCIDDAMREMNYSVVGSREVTKKNGKHFKNVLYKFDEGTAVNVTYSNDGQISMELGGVDTEDRDPTEAESRSLEEDMRSFCDDFYHLERKLKERGIEPKHISHLPPEAQFAQIINVSDYDMSDSIGKYEARATKRPVAQRKQNEMGGEG